MANLSVKRLRSKKRINYDKYPVIIIFRSNKNILGQVLEPISKKVLITVNSNSLDKGTKTDKAALVGKKIGEFLKSNKMDKITFDRNGFLYHGRVKTLAEAIRQQSIEI